MHFFEFFSVHRILLVVFFRENGSVCRVKHRKLKLQLKWPVEKRTETETETNSKTETTTETGIWSSKLTETDQITNFETEISLVHGSLESAAVVMTFDTKLTI
jgi:hypothetical protein